MLKKKRLVSGITISGDLTIAHFLVVIKQLKKLADKYDLFLFIADLHAITTTHNPSLLKERRLEMAMYYLACGIPTESIFVQSEITGHTDLAFLFACHTSLGELKRMTQFKSKQNQTENAFALLSYPLLMAADILIYDADVMVGPDQKQHVELTRNLAQRMNNKFGKLFRLPENIIDETNHYRIRDLQNPLQKMSKSKQKAQGILFLKDSPETIRQKIRSCVTDSKNTIQFNFDEQPGVSNLILIYALSKELTIPDATVFLQKNCANYLVLKETVAKAVIEILEPIQRQMNLYQKDLSKVMDILKKGNQRAQKIAAQKMQEISTQIGFPFMRFRNLLQEN